MKLPIRVARWAFRVNRWRGLSRANAYFTGASPNLLVDTPLFGFTMPLRVARSPVHRLLSLQQERFIEERSLLAPLVGPGGRVIDVGANIGYYLLLFRHLVGDRGAVLCLEPEPDNCAELQACIDRNRFQNVRLLAAAAGDRPGQVRLELGLNGRVSGSEGAIEVPQVALDQFCREAPSLVKIDVEGYEGQVLSGMPRMLASVRPNLFIEVHPQWLPAEFSPSRLLSVVTPHYGRIEFWEPNRPATALGKAISPWLPRGLIRPIRVPAGSCPERRNPYWMICRR